MESQLAGDWLLFTAAQAAQKSLALICAILIMFTAAQAAQKFLKNKKPR